MKYSRLFAKTSKTAQETEAINARLLVQAGFVRQEMAGVYSYLPFGLRVLRKIEQIVREEMNAIGGEELLMAMLHPKANWVQTGGWDNIDVLFKIKSRTENEYALGQSEEEIVTPLVMSRIQSYRELPVATYQIHWKFRDELRAKSGVMRGREFLMKDMYSFHENEEDFLRFYKIAKEAYLKVYKRMGLTAKVTEASGGAFSQKISYEFMVLTDAGEDDILYCQDCDFCVNVEIATVKLGDSCGHCEKGVLAQARASEVGNVFDLGQKYTKDFDLPIVDQDNQRTYPWMGCYGIGISRAMGVIVEASHDEKGIIWPKTVAPFHVQLVSLRSKDAEVQARINQTALELHDQLEQQGIEVLWDEREGVSPGEKFADADLIGLPLRLVVSEKTLKEHAVEWKERCVQEAKLVSLVDVVDAVKAWKTL
jgi:prolyl-tRNA synthetase